MPLRYRQVPPMNAAVSFEGDGHQSTIYSQSDLVTIRYGLENLGPSNLHKRYNTYLEILRYEFDSSSDSEGGIQSSRIHCFITITLTQSRNTKTMVVIERHIATQRMSHLRMETGSVKFEVCPGGGGKAGIDSGDPMLSADKRNLTKRIHEEENSHQKAKSQRSRPQNVSISGRSSSCRRHSRIGARCAVPPGELHIDF